MVARILQTTSLALVASALAWFGYFLACGQPIFALGGAVLIGFGYALILGLEFVLLALFGRDGSISPAPARHLLGAWVKELVHSPVVFAWRQPFREAAEPDSLSGTSLAKRHGVLLVHGFLCNRAIWNPWMRILRRSGVPFAAVNLEPPWSPLDVLVPVVGHAVDRMFAATGLPPVIVAHSMGGLVVRAWHAEPTNAARVAKIVTIATPHHGTWLGCIGWTPNARQMRSGSEWLKALAAREAPPTYRKFICYFGNCDNIVFPTASATLEGADNRHLDVTPHVQMVYHAAVLAEVLRLATGDAMEEDRPPPARAPA